MKMRIIRKIAVLPLFIITLCYVGCETMSTDPSYMASLSYQQQEAAETTLFKSDEAILGGETIERILNARVVLPSHARLAILPLHEYSGRGLWSAGSADTEKEKKAQIISQLKRSKRLADVFILPTLLTPKKKGIPQLREAAARLQAHLLLAYKAYFNTFGKDRFIGPDEATTYCVVEAVLLDVRTGIVPFTSVSLQTYKVVRRSDELNLYEASLRAQMEAETAGLKEIARDLVAFLDALPVESAKN